MLENLWKTQIVRYIVGTQVWHSRRLCFNARHTLVQRALLTNSYSSSHTRVMAHRW